MIDPEEFGIEEIESMGQAPEGDVWSSAMSDEADYYADEWLEAHDGNQG
jgi:hypothetical protein